MSSDHSILREKLCPPWLRRDRAGSFTPERVTNPFVARTTVVDVGPECFSAFTVQFLVSFIFAMGNVFPIADGWSPTPKCVP